MKSTLTLCFIGLTFLAKAQIELIYESPAHSGPVLVSDNNVKNAVVDFNTHPTEFNIYNLDNSLFRTCQLPTGVEATGSWWVSYPTLTLFDCDSTNLEYILVRPGNQSQSIEPHTRVVREDGTVLLDIPGCTFSGASNSPTAGSGGGLYNDGNSAVMFVLEGIHYFHPSRYYRLCGAAPAMYSASQGGITGVESIEEGAKTGMMLFPNPTATSIRIKYELPAGATNGILRVFDLQGRMIKEWNVTHQFDHIVFDVSNLESGNYIAHLLLNNGTKVSEKFVKIGN